MSPLTPVDDRTNAVLSSALRGLAARQRTAARNIANADTPGFVAKRVEFEESLRAAVAAGNPHGLVVSETESSDPAAMNGNNVLLDEESMTLEETGLRYQLVTEAITARARLFRSSMGR